MVEKTFFVNLKAESSKSLSHKVQLIVKELEKRTSKPRTEKVNPVNKSISNIEKSDIETEQIERKIKSWSKKPDYKISRCLSIMKKSGWSIPIQTWKKIMKEQLLVNDPDLFLVGLTKKPSKRVWTNTEGKKKSASDYGDILAVKNKDVTLNKKYKKIITKYW